MKHRIGLLSTTIYCGIVTAASAMLLSGAPADSLDPGFASIGNYFAAIGADISINDYAARAVSTDPEPGIMAFMSVSLAGGSVVASRHRLRFRDPAIALGLLIYLAPVLTLAALAVRLSGRGPLFQPFDVVTREGQRVRLRHFRTMPSSNARRWQRRTQAFLRVSRIACLPGLFGVMRGDVALRDVFANDVSGAVPAVSTAG